MSYRYLFGPVNSGFASRYLERQRKAGQCLTFDASGSADIRIAPGDSWDAVIQRLPEGWQPDFVVLYPAYRTIPECLWSAPLPVVALAEDWNLLWHSMRRQLTGCDLILTDSAGVRTLSQGGIGPTRLANLYGCERPFLEAAWPAGPRDIDVLFVGNLHPAVQRERLRWLGRIAALAGRWHVVIRSGVFGEDYRALLAQPDRLQPQYPR